MESFGISAAYQMSPANFKIVGDIVKGVMAALYKLSPEFYYWGAGDHQDKFTIIHYDDDAFFDKLQSMARFGKPLYQFQKLGARKKIVDETTTDEWNFTFYLANKDGLSKGKSNDAPVPDISLVCKVVKNQSLSIGFGLEENEVNQYGGLQFIEKTYRVFKELFCEEYNLIKADVYYSALFYDGRRDESLKKYYPHITNPSNYYWGTLRANWMGYINRPGLLDSMPDDIELYTYQKGTNGGLTYRLTEEKPDIKNLEQKQKVFALQSALDACFISEKMVETDGFLPPWGYHDDAYAQQITCATLGMKYMVRSAAFDGYDSERKVLLFAKLFYLDPPQTKERIQEVISDRNDWAGSLYFSAYAYHQLSTLDYIHDSTPIEWHIGIKEHADAIGYLFKHGLQIPEGRLKVIYTPYEGELPVLEN